MKAAMRRAASPFAVCSRALWTLQIWAALGLLLALASFAFHPTRPALLWIAFGLIVIYFLLKGVRWLWILSLGMTLLYAVGWLLYGNYVGVISNTGALVLLLARPTRQFFSQPPLIP